MLRLLPLLGTWECLLFNKVNGSEVGVNDIAWLYIGKEGESQLRFVSIEGGVERWTWEFGQLQSIRGSFLLDIWWWLSQKVLRLVKWLVCARYQSKRRRVRFFLKCLLIENSILICNYWGHLSTWGLYFSVICYKNYQACQIYIYPCLDIDKIGWKLVSILIEFLDELNHL